MDRGRPPIANETKALKRDLGAIRRRKGRLLTQMGVLVREAEKLDLDLQVLTQDYGFLRARFEKEEAKWTNRTGIVKARETEIRGRLSRSQENGH